MKKCLAHATVVSLSARKFGTGQKSFIGPGSDKKWYSMEENSDSWTRLSLIGDETVINLQRTKVYVFSDSVLCLGEIFENPQSNDAWEERLQWFKSSPDCRNFDRIDGEPMEFDRNIFQGFNTLQLSEEVKCLLLRSGETPENFTGRIVFMSVFNDISCGSKDNEKECLSNANLVSLCAKRFGTGQWSFIGPGSEKKWYSISEDSPQGEWEIMAARMMKNSQKADIQFSVLQVHCPEVGSKAKAMENCRGTIVQIWKQLRLFSHDFFCK